MRDSWDRRRFWFNLASRCSFDVDDYYWQILHEEHLGEAMLDDAVLSDKKRLIEHKMRQVRAYFNDKEQDKRFSNGAS